MRKIVCSILLMIVLLSVRGQDDQEYKKVRLGIMASPHISWIRTDDPAIDPTAPHLGGNYGLMIDLNLSKNYTLATGIYSGHTGAWFRTDSIPAPPNTSTHLIIQYIEVPLTFKLKTNEIGYTTYFATIGFVPSFRVQSKFRNDSLGKVGIARPDNLYGFQVPFFDAPFQVGGGIEYAFTPETSLYLSITFNNSLFDIFTSGAAEKTVLRNVAIRAGVFF